MTGEAVKWPYVRQIRGREHALRSWAHAAVFQISDGLRDPGAMRQLRFPAQLGTRRAVPLGDRRRGHPR